MSRELDADDRAMLCLAALTYRGFSSTRIGEGHHERLKRVIARGLDGELDPLGRRWRLVWGPASYRTIGAVVDDAMMFVAYEQTSDRYAVAVRGTNPVSGFDWLFGDLWVAGQIPWAYGNDDDGAALSLSTALGLRILQNLGSGSEPAPDAPVPPQSPLASAEERLERIFERWQLRPEGWSLVAIANLRKALGRNAHLGLFSLFEDVIGLRGRIDRGETLIAFLERNRARRICVTGHSKGGALAPALALWLAETLDAEVSCWAFAGPSPGNAAFAKRFNTLFGDRFRAVVNPLDLVPHAWEPETLAKLPTLYEPDAKCHDPLRKVIDHLPGCMQELKEAGRDYAHLSRSPIACDPGRNTDESHYLGQVIHHHLDGYFIGAGLNLGVADFFDPFQRYATTPAIDELVKRAPDEETARQISQQLRRTSFPGLLALLAAPHERRDPVPPRGLPQDEAALELLTSGELFGDLRHTLTAIASATGRVPKGLLSDLPRLPQRLTALVTSAREDAADLPRLALDVLDDLREDGTVDRRHELLTHTLGSLLDLATAETTAQLVADLLHPANRAFRIALVQYARGNGIPLEERDLDRLRETVLTSPAPDLGPLLADAVERARAHYGGGILEKLARSRAAGT